MTETYTFEGVEYTHDDLMNLSGDAQVELFNKISDTMGLIHATRFGDKTNGANRIYARLQEHSTRLVKKVWPDDEATGTKFTPPPIHEVEEEREQIMQALSDLGQAMESPKVPPEVDDSVTFGPTEGPIETTGQGQDADPPAQAPVVSTPSVRRKRQKYFNFPVSDDGVKTPRTGTLRDRVLAQMTTNGLTFEEVVVLVRDFDGDRIASGKDLRGSDEHQERRAYEILRIIHYNLGYGMRHDQTTGKITVFK